MVDKQRIIDVLHRLKLTQIDRAWAKSIWEAEFGNHLGLPAEIQEDYTQNDYHVTDLKRTQDLLLPWSRHQETPQGEGFWSILIEEDIPYKSLVALLFTIIETGIQRASNRTQKEAAVLSAGLYYTLIKIPGSGAFKIFHPVLFERSLMLFRMWTQLEQASGKRKRASKSSDDGRNKKQQRMSQRSKDVGSDKENPFEEEEEEDDDDDDDHIAILSHNDVMAITQVLTGLLKIFVDLLSTFSLRDSEQSSILSVQAMAELSRLEPKTYSGKFNKDTPTDEINSVPGLAFKGLFLLCSERHGDQAKLLNLVLKHLFPSLIMTTENNQMTSTTMPLQIVKNHTEDFICHLVKLLPKEISMKQLYILVQHMCAKVPDKADYRAKVSQSILVLLRHMTTMTFAKLIEWLYKFSQNTKTGWRGFALDIIALLLLEPERTDVVDVPQEHLVFLSHHFLLQVLISACSDIAPSVRARAISILAQCLTSEEESLSNLIKEMLTPCAPNKQPRTRVIKTPKPNQEEPQKDSPVTNMTPSSNKLLSMIRSATSGQDLNTPTANRHSFAMMMIELTPGFRLCITDNEGVRSMLRQRAGDVKVNVRRAALQALQSIINLMEDFDKQDLDIIENRCRDLALSVRKEAMQCLTLLLWSKPNNELIHSAWLSGVLPLIMDRESSIQEKCLEILKEILLDNIVKKERSVETKHQMVWLLLKNIASSGQVELRRYLQRACQSWSAAGKLKSSLTVALQTHINTENNEGAWMLLVEMSTCTDKFDVDFIIDYWEQFAHNAPDSENHVVEKVLLVLGNLANNIAPKKCEQLADQLKQKLMRFNLPPELIVATVNTLYKLCLAQCQSKTAVKKVTDQWFEGLLNACDKYLSDVILHQNQDASFDEDCIIRHLFTLGEMTQICPTKTSKRAVLLVQSLVAAPIISEESDDSHGEEVTQKGLLSQSSKSTQNSEVPACSGSQPLSKNSQMPISQFCVSQMSARIRAHAFLTLGKLCLQNRELAKKCVSALARELEMSKDQAVRNNIVVIMTDLCIRFTTLIDRYLPNISSCLQDSSPLIRKQCLILLTRLIQEDYLKWKGTLFFHFVSTLVDEVEEIRAFAAFCLTHLLMQRNPAMFYQHFIECIFFFNDYQDHSVYNRFNQSARERRLFALKGKQNQEKRMKIYCFLLDHMSDRHRFELTSKLCQDILAAIVSDILPLNSDTIPLLQDALAILVCKEIKLSRLRSRPQDEIAETEQEMAVVVMNVASKAIVSQVVKKNVIENIVPTVISLKHLLERKHSAALKDLMTFLNELMKDYKTEVKDVMAADPQLAKEIEFDLRRFDEQQQAQSTPEVQANGPLRVAGTPNSRGEPQVDGRRRTKTSSPVNKTPQVPTTRDKVETANSAENATPVRSLPLVMLTVRESARKVIEELNRSEASCEKAIPKGSHPSDRAISKKVGFNNVSSCASPNVEGNSKAPVTQKIDRRTARAISTPTTNLTLSNITFRQDLSIISRSPSSGNGGVFSQEGSMSSLEKKIDDSYNVGDDGSDEQRVEHIISMPLPGTPEPVKWNIRSRKHSGSKRGSKCNKQQEDVENFSSARRASLRSNSYLSAADNSSLQDTSSETNNSMNKDPKPKATHQKKLVKQTRRQRQKASLHSSNRLAHN